MIVSSEEMMYKAVKMFKEQGMENVSVPMICNAFSVTKGSFYHHFKSKDDLLLQWIIRNYQEIESKYIERDEVITYDDYKKKCMIWGKFVEECGHDLCIASINTIVMYQKNPKAFTPIEKSLLNTSDIQTIEYLIETNQIRNRLSARQLVQLYSNLIIGISLDWAMHNAEFDINQQIEEAFGFVFEKMEPTRSV